MTLPFPLKALALVGLASATLGVPVQAQTPSWLSDPAAQAQLSAGQVVIRSVLGPRQASARAAVRVHATAPVIWKLITSCASVASFVPGLTRCARLETSADGAWATVEHDIRYSRLMPLIRSIVRSHYQAPERVDFTGVGGNVKAESGSWVLEPAAQAGVTTVEYSISVEPGLFIPRAVVRHSLGKELPLMLAGLRARAERIASGAALAKAPAASAPER